MLCIDFCSSSFAQTTIVNQKSKHCKASQQQGLVGIHNNSSSTLGIHLHLTPPATVYERAVHYCSNLHYTHTRRHMASTSKQPLLLEATAASEATGWRRGQHLIDALPYIDTLNDKQKKEVETLLEQEVRGWWAVGDAAWQTCLIGRCASPTDECKCQDPCRLSHRASALATISD